MLLDDALTNYLPRCLSSYPLVSNFHEKCCWNGTTDGRNILVSIVVYSCMYNESRWTRWTSTFSDGAECITLPFIFFIFKSNSLVSLLVIYCFSCSLHLYCWFLFWSIFGLAYSSGRNEGTLPPHSSVIASAIIGLVPRGYASYVWPGCSPAPHAWQLATAIDLPYDYSQADRLCVSLNDRKRATEYDVRIPNFLSLYTV